MADMDITQDIFSELAKMGFSDPVKLSLDKLRAKDGIHLFQLHYQDDSYVLKYFEKQGDTREISNYRILNHLKIPAIKVLACTGKSLLLEDINCSETYRLGVPDDLSDPDTARLIARWYKHLHTAGKKYVEEVKCNLYRETDDINEENIVLVRDKSNTQDNPVWPLILTHMQEIRNTLSKLDETLTYNDFFWTNLAVRRDKTAALMFDYNLLGVGYRYGDVRNVCSALSDNCKSIFLEEYREYPAAEEFIDYGISVLVSLISAFQRAIFPSWANDSLEQVKNGSLYNWVNEMLQRNHTAI